MGIGRLFGRKDPRAAANAAALLPDLMFGGLNADRMSRGLHPIRVARMRGGGTTFGQEWCDAAVADAVAHAADIMVDDPVAAAAASMQADGKFEGTPGGPLTPYSDRPHGLHEATDRDANGNRWIPGVAATCYYTERHLTNVQEAAHKMLHYWRRRGYCAFAIDPGPDAGQADDDACIAGNIACGGTRIDDPGIDFVAAAVFVVPCLSSAETGAAGDPDGLRSARVNSGYRDSRNAACAGDREDGVPLREPAA